MLDALVFEHTVRALVVADSRTAGGGTHLYSLCMKAVCTTLGCCAAAAAPTTGARLPLPVGDMFPASLSVAEFWPGSVPFRSALGLFRLGGPIEEAPDGVMSMASRGGASDEPDEGRMGMDRWRPCLLYTSPSPRD